MIRYIVNVTTLAVTAAGGLQGKRTIIAIKAVNLKIMYQDPGDITLATPDES